MIEKAVDFLYTPSDDSELVDVIPNPPEPYIPHKYTLLEGAGLVGREEQIDTIYKWFNGTIPLLCIDSIGGAGKSALAWHWLEEFKKNHNTGEGRFDRIVWWSFYEFKSSFENFISKTLQYITSKSLEQVTDEFPDHDNRITELINQLRKNKTLLVLDGFERRMAGYTEMKRRAKEAEHEDSETALKRFTEKEGVDYSKEQLGDMYFDEQDIDVSAHKRFRMINEQEARFLFALTEMPDTKTLITSRYFPSALENEDSLDNIGQASKLTLKEIEPEQQIAMTEAIFKANKIIPSEIHYAIAKQIEYLPLYICLMAGYTARNSDPITDNSIQEIQKGNISARDLKCDIICKCIEDDKEEDRLSHEKRLKVLAYLTIFPSAVKRDDLIDFFVNQRQWFRGEGELIATLAFLRKRKLIGLDKGNNSYGVHPNVCGYVSENYPEVKKEVAYEIQKDKNLDKCISQIQNSKEFKEEDLNNDPMVAFNCSITSGQIEKACTLFQPLYNILRFHSFLFIEANDLVNGMYDALKEIDGETKEYSEISVKCFNNKFDISSFYGDNRALASKASQAPNYLNDSFSNKSKSETLVYLGDYEKCQLNYRDAIKCFLVADRLDRDMHWAMVHF